MVSTVLVIAGVLVGLFVLLAVIVRLSAPPTTAGRTTGTDAARWAADPGQPQADAWTPLSTSGTQVRTVR